MNFLIIFLLQVTLECGAHNTGYCKPDIASSCPKGECCVEGAEDEASTLGLNIDIEIDRMGSPAPPSESQVRQGVSGPARPAVRLGALSARIDHGQC